MTATTTAAAPRRPAAEDALGTYLRDIEPVCALADRQEEVSLAARIAAGDADARRRLIQANLRLVVKVARGYQGNGVSLADLVAEGNIGLIRAVDHFKAEYEVRFATYAVYWIRKAILGAIRYATRAVRLPAYIADLVETWKGTVAHLSQQWGIAPSETDVADALGLEPRLVKLVRIALHWQEQSADDEHGDTVLAADHRLAPDDLAVEAEETARLRTALRNSLAGLAEAVDPRCAPILEKRFGLSGAKPMAYKDIGQSLGVCRERVRQIEVLAMIKLRRDLGVA